MIDPTLIPDPDGVTDEEIRRLRWQCRRGMLELDHLLLPFLDRAEGYRALDPARRTEFVALLGQQDQDLSNWFMSRLVPENPRVHHLIQHILAVVAADRS